MTDMTPIKKVYKKKPNEIKKICDKNDFFYLLRNKIAIIALIHPKLSRKMRSVL